MVSEIREDVYLGDIDDYRRYHDEFDHVLSLLYWKSPPEHSDVFVELRDGQNEQEDFDRAVDYCRQLLREEGSLLVHCSAGVSRSATVLITAIAAEEDMTFEDVRQDVWRKRQIINPMPDLVEHANEYLAD